MCCRWTKRREDFEESISENLTEDTTIEPVVQQDNGDSQGEETGFQNQMPASDSKRTNEVLLLPSVVVPDKTHESAEEIKLRLPIATLSSMDSVSVISYYQDTQKKITDALQLAQYYRNLAEKLQDQKLQSEEEMERKVRHIRKFWRNSIMECSSRGGKIVKMSLQKQLNS